MTQLEQAKRGVVSPQMSEITRLEGVDEEKLLPAMASGRVVLPYNQTTKRSIHACAIGEGLRTKINVNLGTSQEKMDLELEWQKIGLCHQYRVDTLMDLSTGGDLKQIRKQVLRRSQIPVGTVPLYGTLQRLEKEGRKLERLTGEDIFQDIDEHGRQGVDFITVHCGITAESLAALERSQRICGIVSRGGAILSHWVSLTGRENPMYADYDRLLEIAKRHDMTLSLGDGLRPGAIADATDEAQLSELKLLGQLAKRALEAGVQCMIEGPGHVPLKDIQKNIKLQKEICNGAPFYVLGPLVTDVAPGYDHLTSAIGAAIAGSAGADFLCYVTPAEHIRLPNLEDVRQGIVAYRIAAHAADLSKNYERAGKWDEKMSRARKTLDWPAQIALSLDPERVREMLGDQVPEKGTACSMCGPFCAFQHAAESQKQI